MQDPKELKKKRAGVFLVYKNIRKFMILRGVLARWRIIWFLKEGKYTPQCDSEVRCDEIAYNPVPKGRKIYAAVRF